MISIIKVAKQYKLKVIEDCAQSFGAKIKSKMTGTFGSFGCFSFFPTKNLGTAGDGGMMVTDNQSYYNKALKLRNHGGLERNIHNYLGYNSRLDEIQAAIANLKLDYLDEWNNKYLAIAKFYIKELSNNRNYYYLIFIFNHAIQSSKRSDPRNCVRYQCSSHCRLDISKGESKNSQH